MSHEINTESMAAGVELITPEVAGRLLDNFQYERQRELKHWQVKRLELEIARGNFKPTSILIAYCYETNQHYLLDGQHRLTAIRNYGAPVALFVNRVKLQTLAEVAQWYANTDQNLSRSMLNGLKVLGIPEETGIPEPMLRYIGSGVKIIYDGFQQGSISSSREGEDIRSISVRAEWIREWAAEANQYIDQVQLAHKPLRNTLLRQPVVGVALVTLRYQPELAELFWRTVAENDGLRRGEPAHTLVNFLLGETVRKGLIHHYARKVAITWNHYVQGHSLYKIILRDPNRPILIQGTPYDGKATIRWRPQNATVVTPAGTEPPVEAELEIPAAPTPEPVAA